MLRTAMKGGLAALVVAVMTVGAYAWPAAATTTLNVRAGPGTHFHVVDVLARHEAVNVDYCRGSWCFVQTQSTQGWASSNYLRAISYQQPSWPRPPHWNPAPPPPVWHQPAPPPHWGAPPAWGGWNGWGARPQVCVNSSTANLCVGG